MKCEIAKKLFARSKEVRMEATLTAQYPDTRPQLSENCGSKPALAMEYVIGQNCFLRFCSACARLRAVRQLLLRAFYWACGERSKRDASHQRFNWLRICK